MSQNKGKRDIVGGIVYIILGLAFLGVGVLGVTYRMDPENATRPFLTENNKVTYTKHQAGNAMIPIGLASGLGLIGFGAFRMKPQEEEDGGDDE